MQSGSHPAGTMAAMSGRQRLGIVAAIGGVVLGGLAVVVIPRLSEPAPAAPAFPAPVYPATQPAPHPVIPTETRVEQPKPFCERRDIFIVGRTMRDAQKRSLTAAKAGAVKGAPESCRTEPGARALAQELNPLIGRTGACVARDSELDSPWSQLESAVAALDRCIDCTQPRDARVTACKRALELVDDAGKSVK
jgi:hypothetical protein